YTQLIARRIRELAVYSEIHPYSMSLEDIRKRDPLAIVLSGGPASCYEPGAPTGSPELFQLGIPTLAICYGAQLAVELLGGRVVASDKREYGRAHIKVERTDNLFHGFSPDEEIAVWMSHGDRVDSLPEGFVLTGTTANTPAAAFEHPYRKIHAVQFHPE